MKKPKRTAKTTPADPSLKSSIGDDLRQAVFPRPFRIPAPAADPAAAPAAEAPAPPPPPAQTPPPPKPEHDRRRDLKAIAELANCLWYIKAKYFKRKWDDVEASDDDPRVRRALGRINRCTEELRKAGIEVQDPTGKRYPQGGEAMMRPVELLPTDGISVEVVSDTVTPMIFLNEALLQRAEVFIAVPKQPVSSPAEAPRPEPVVAPSAESTPPVPAAAAPAAEPAAEPAENNLQPPRNAEPAAE